MTTGTPVCDFGWKAVDVALPATDGQSYSITECAGPNGLLVAFICKHCPYVKAVIDRLVRDASELKPLGIGAVAVCSNCFIPRCGGTVGHHAERDALWVRFFTAAPARQRRSVARYSFVKRA